MSDLLSFSSPVPRSILSEMSESAFFPQFFRKVKGRYPSELSITHLAELFKSPLSCDRRCLTRENPVLLQIQIMQM